MAPPPASAQEAEGPAASTARSLACGSAQGASAFARLEESPCFRNAGLLLIVLNAAWICVDVEWNHSRLRRAGKLPLEPASIVVENAFCMLFTAELVVRFLAFRRKLLALRDAWFLFDAALVAFMVLETWLLPMAEVLFGSGGGEGALSGLSSFRLLRLLRLTRMAKIMRFFPELMTLIKGMVSATQAVFFILLFLVIVMYVFAILFTSQLGEGPEVAAASEGGGEDPTARELFADMGSSMMTLFTNGVLGDNLAQTLQAIKDESLWLMWLFVLFMLISGVTLLNMLIGVLCQVIDDSSREEEEARQLATLRGTMAEAFSSMDLSKDGVVSEAEWGRLQNSATVRASLTKLGVDEGQMDERLGQMQETLFGRGRGRGSEGEAQASCGLGFEEFVEKVVELRWDTPARALDVEMLKATVTSEDKALRRRLERVEAGLARLLAAGGAGGAGAAPRRGTGPRGRAPGTGDAAWLAEVPTELLFHALKARG